MMGGYKRKIRRAFVAIRGVFSENLFDLPQRHRATEGNTVGAGLPRPCCGLWFYVGATLF